ncbi:MAG: hypothetical protein K0Q68_1133 [Moraxellaceae bacterium]|nr:hypothetical protein [Moraxellaceae bacterium]
MDWHQGSIISSGGVYGSARLLEGWGTAGETIALDALLRRAVRDGPALFRDLQPGDRQQRTRLDAAFLRVRDLLGRCDSRIQFSPLLFHLIGIAGDMGMAYQPLVTPGSRWVPMPSPVGPAPQSHADAFDELLSRVVEVGRKPAVRVACRRWWEQAEDDFTSANAYLDACLKVSPRLFVLRLDLGDWGSLLADSPRPPVIGDVQEVKARFSRFARALSRTDRKAIVGYMARLDFSPAKGFFHHVIILLQGGQADNAVDWCERLGQRWVGLAPEGEGAFSGCNWIFKSPASAVGLIEAGRPADRVAMERWVLPYLTLASRYSRVCLKPRQRVFTRGILSKAGQEK